MSGLGVVVSVQRAAASRHPAPPLRKPHAVTDPTAWPLANLADCAGCGHRIVPRADVAEGRFYGCGCPETIIDADDLDDTVGAAVLDHLIARMRSLSFPADRLRSAWRRASPAGRRAMIMTELAMVTVTHIDGQLRVATTWHTERPALSPPVYESRRP